MNLALSCPQVCLKILSGATTPPVKGLLVVSLLKMPSARALEAVVIKEHLALLSWQHWIWTELQQRAVWVVPVLNWGFCSPLEGEGRKAGACSTR